jgi:hypothetical protein
VREAFKRGCAALTKAQALFVLDGYASEFVSLQQSRSQFYKLLAVFEPDEKRKLAMHAKRCELLLPLLQQLNVKVPEFVLT